MWDEPSQQYAHPAGIVVATPHGKVSRYLFGIDYGPRDLRLALLDASGEKIGSPLERVLLYCYHYDLATGRYSLAIMRVVRLAGAATVFSLGTLIFVWTRRERRQVGLRHMFGIPLFPERASTIADEVDALYFFLVGLSVVMSVLIATLVVSFAIKFRRRHPDDVGAQVHGGLMLELAWTVVPFVITMVIFFWGAKVYFVMASPPPETLNIYVVGKQWMWKVQHIDRAARDQPAARAGRPSGQAHHDVGRRHPRFLDPGDARQSRRDSRPLRPDLVRADQAGHLSDLLR